MVVIVTTSILFACGAARLPAPTFVRQTTDALARVDFPPPPARVELVPARPQKDAVWVDGEWVWQGTRWAWKPGRWVAPPANAAFSPWTAVRNAHGDLYVAEGRWRDSDGGELADPKPLAVGRTGPGTIVSPQGEEMSPGPNVPAQAVPQQEDGGAEEGPPETPSGATPTGTRPKTGREPILDDAGAPAP